ncbi:WbqC family protein [Streptomyces cavourensis]|uniref:WbqC family protein n=1 Tax=Streptomyces cavourensis TaxID=67258 RepID=UPI002278648B|nr:WbqC family protein [Streptomyces cavourensis]WAE70344.1 WbqC family protein [Streptomyces cavourensis]
MHQPNFFPRLSTLAKLYAADCWVVLDDVQFTRRDFQHRARLAALGDPGERQWLTLATHLPHGRQSRISEARIVDPAISRKRVGLLLRQHYGRSPHWSTLEAVIAPVLELVAADGRTAVIAETSTRLLLDLLGWHGSVVRRSTYSVRAERSERLADLATEVGADTYLCGTGGARYLSLAPFDEYGIGVAHFRPPARGGAWTGAREISVIWALATYGPQHLTDLLLDGSRA